MVIGLGHCVGGVFVTLASNARACTESGRLCGHRLLQGMVLRSILLGHGREGSLSLMEASTKPRPTVGPNPTVVVPVVGVNGANLEVETMNQS